MYFKSYFSKEKKEEDAVKDIYNHIHNENVKILIFFSSTNYNFDKLSEEFFNISQNEFIVLGCTSSGEIAQNSGITKGGLSAIAFGESNMQIETIIIENVNKVPLLYRDDIIEKFNNMGYSLEENEYKNLVGILLIDGLHSAEEKVLSVINSVFDGKLNLIGGSAGDDLKFKETLLSLNGKIIKSGAVLTLLKTTTGNQIYRENIFESQEIFINITKADEKNRKIIEIDGKPAKTRYAELLNIPKSSIEDYIMQNPIGRIVGESTYISSIASINGEELNMYAQVFENSRAEILKAKDPLKVQIETLKKIKSEFEKIDGVFCINCILRSLQFEKQGNISEISKGLSSLGEYGGFVSYGEQYKKQHLNQTLTMLVFGRRLK